MTGRPTGPPETPVAKRVWLSDTAKAVRATARVLATTTGMHTVDLRGAAISVGVQPATAVHRRAGDDVHVAHAQADGQRVAETVARLLTRMRGLPRPEAPR
jgi:hypothetical protein